MDLLAKKEAAAAGSPLDSPSAPDAFEWKNFGHAIKNLVCHLILMNTRLPTLETWMIYPLGDVPEYQTLQLDLQIYFQFIGKKSDSITLH